MVKALIKRQKVAEWIRTYDPYIYYLQGIHCRIKTYTLTKVKI